MHLASVLESQIHTSDALSLNLSTFKTKKHFDMRGCPGPTPAHPPTTQRIVVLPTSASTIIPPWRQVELGHCVQLFYVYTFMCILHVYAISFLQVAGFCMNQVKFADTDPAPSADNVSPIAAKKWDDITKQEMDAYKKILTECCKSDLLGKNG